MRNAKCTYCLLPAACCRLLLDPFKYLLHQPHQLRLSPLCCGNDLLNGSRLVVIRYVYVGNY